MDKLQRIGITGLAIAAVAVAIVTLSPSRLDLLFRPQVLALINHLHQLGVTKKFDFDELEFAANIVLVVPVGFFLGLALSKRYRWVAYCAFPILFAGVELIQRFALPDRIPSILDVVANSLGGWSGLILASLLCLWRRPSLKGESRELRKHIAQDRETRGGNASEGREAKGRVSAGHRDPLAV
ncbi:MAG: VanZ family protein [Ancrocorticia sp.]